MDPQQLPLEPLIAPPPISWWPLAPIWWILLVAIVLIILVTVRYFAKKRTVKKPTTNPAEIDLRRQMALDELANLPKPYDQTAGLWLQQINNLLKRICNSRYPTENSKVLMGQSWLNFLNTKCPTAHITQFTALVEGEYQANYYMDKTTIDALYSALEHWITHHV